MPPTRASTGRGRSRRPSSRPAPREVVDRRRGAAVAAIAELVSTGDSVLAVCADAGRRRALAASAADPRRFGAGEPLIACCRCGEAELDAALGSGTRRSTRAASSSRTGGRSPAGPAAARRFQHVVLVDPPPFERFDDLGAAPAARLPAPGVERGRGRARRALRGEGVGAPRSDLRGLAGARRGRLAGGRGPARGARRGLSLPAHARGRRPLRTRPVRARPGRADRGWHRTRPPGLILGEDRAGAVAGLRGRSRPARGGKAIPASKSTELKDGHTRVGEPVGPHQAAKPDAITKKLSDRRARAARRPVRGDRGALVRARSSRSTATRSSARSRSPARATRARSASRARTSSPTRSASRGSAPACGSTPRP